MSFLNLMKNRLKPKRVNDALSEVSGDVSDLETAVTTINGTITNTIIPRLPKDYSSTDEVNTGQKWVDGKDIYCKTFAGDIDAIIELTNVQLAENFSSMIWSVGYVATSNNRYYGLNGYVSSTIRSSVTIQSDALYLTVGAGLSEGSYEIIVYYTKPDPEPEPEPTEAKKRTKKTN